MDWPSATMCYSTQLIAESPNPIKLNFIKPLKSTILAASALTYRFQERLAFTGDSESYARNSGLLSALGLENASLSIGRLAGQTYSPLTKLSSESDVEYCNQIVGDLLETQLERDCNAKFISLIREVIGELHDNVFSHANGAGFCAAQVYRTNPQKLSYALTDCGRGMLRNVRRIHPQINDHAEAIDWCLRKGNTTAKGGSDWAQKIPDDVGATPFAGHIDTFSSRNHHVGHGLWKLTELVKLAGGNAWIWSGNRSLSINHVSRNIQQWNCDWSGVSIELEFQIDRTRRIDTDQLRSSVPADLAERLGL